MISISDIDLSLKEEKKYWKNGHREWKEGFIYFLVPDRFHDNAKRHSLHFSDRHAGFGDARQLRESCGGSIRGIIDNLDYIKHPGCTAIWLSPVFENNPESSHGYAIQNYLEIDRRWNTITDLQESVELAHVYGMRVFLDMQSYIYKHIAEIALLHQKESMMKFGRMFLREISSDGHHFHLPNCPHYTLAFSRMLFEEEILVVYNSSPSDAKEEYILIDSTLNKTRKT